jgi:hypothetical protein
MPRRLRFIDGRWVGVEVDWSQLDRGFMDVRWRDEPLSVEKLYANPHYCRWARETYGLYRLTRLLVATRREEGHHQETREEMFKAIAKLLGVDNWKKVKNAANRSSKVIPKRRQ